MTTSSPPGFYPTTFILEVDDPCNTTFLNGRDPTGRASYSVQTKRVEIGPRRDISVTTEVFDASKSLLASLQWMDYVSDIVTMRSRGMERMPLKKWLNKTKLPFVERYLFAIAMNP